MSLTSPYRSSNSKLTPLRAILLLAVAGCFVGCEQTGQTRERVMRLGTTTTTRDSGILDALLPDFEQSAHVAVDVIASGTGKTLALGRAGEVDVLLVHDPIAEEEFMQQGHGTRREAVMHNKFLLLGPADDPASIRDHKVEEGLHEIAASGAKFLSRGDASGTHQRELQLWTAGGGLVEWPEYLETGQGAGPTLTMADQLQGYTLVDRGTYLKFRKQINLVPLSENSDLLLNRYSAITIDPHKHPAIQKELAEQFVDYMISPETQHKIAEYRIAGETLFHPARLAERKP